MKKINNPIKWLVGTALCAVLFSFSTLIGGDSFTIHVNGKQVVQYYVYSKATLPSVSLDQSTANEVSVYYSHCGQIGKGRNLSVKDEKQKVLKVWRFDDVIGDTPMTIKATDIIGLYSAGTNSLNLFYSSHELPEGRQLATLVLTKNLARNQ